MATSIPLDDTLAHAVEYVSVAGKRGHNEDAVLHLTERVGGASVTLLAVADGMGGHAYGEVASELACAALEAAWPDLLAAIDEAASMPDAEREARMFFDRSFADADRHIGGHEGGDGMGTTLTVALLIGPKVLFASVGDSRGYIIRRDDIEQVTEDHSVVADAVRRGVMTEVEAEHSAFQHALTRSLDGSGDASPDLFPAEGGSFDLGKGAVVFVCSDGLYGSLTELDLLEHVVRTEDIATACRALTVHALDRGSQDNVSIVAAETGKLARAPDTIEVDPSHLASTLDGEQPVVAKTQPSYRRAAWGLVAAGVLLLSVAVGFYALSGSAASTNGHERKLLLLPPMSPDTLEWVVEGGDSESYVYLVTVYDAATLSGEPTRSVQLRAQRQALALEDVAAAWPETLRAGTYRWRVDAVGASDTLGSEVGKLVLPRTVPNSRPDPQ